MFRTGKKVRFAANKVIVASLNDAAELLSRGGYHIRVYNAEHKQWNLRMPSEVEVVYA
jgi:hypothetical protein